MEIQLCTIQMIRSILSIILIFPLIHCSIINSYASEVFFLEADEEKTYSHATIDGAFADNRVLVMLKNDASLEFNEYKVTDFSEINCNNVKDMSHSDAQKVKERIKDLRRDGILGVYSANTAKSADIVSNYHQILCIELKNAGKENVIEAINALQKREDILYVGPDFEISISSTVEQYIPDDDYYDIYQWAPGNIHLPETWKLIDSLSKDTVTVGVLDTGINAYHTDFIIKNNETIVNVSGSRDFTHGSADCVSQLTDPNGHGTHVAGII